MKHLRRYFITGLIIVLPVIVTIWLITFLFSLLPGPKTPEFFINLIGETKPTWLPVLFGKGSQVFKKVAVIEYPRKGIYTLVFITNENDKLLHGKLRKAFDSNSDNSEYTNIFLPTTPNPTSGFFLALPKKDVKTLDITVEEALKLIISGGAIKLKELASEEMDG